MLEQELLLPELRITACLHVWTAITYAHKLPLPTLNYTLQTGFAAVPLSFDQVLEQGFWASLGLHTLAQRSVVVATDYAAVTCASVASFPAVQPRPRAPASVSSKASA